MRINIVTTVVQKIIKKVIYIFYNVIMIIMKFIPNQASKEIIFATQFMIIMHGDSLMIFGLF